MSDLPLDLIRMRVLMDALEQFLAADKGPDGQSLKGTPAEASALEMLAELETEIEGL